MATTTMQAHNDFLMDVDNLRAIVLVQVLRTYHGRDRDVDEEGKPTLSKTAARTGLDLLLTTVWGLEDFARSLCGLPAEFTVVGHDGREHTLPYRHAQELPARTEEERDVAARVARVRNRLHELWYSMANKEGLFCINPHIGEFRLGGDPQTDAPIKTVKPKFKSLETAREEIPGTRWERFVSEAGTWHTFKLGQ